MAKFPDLRTVRLVDGPAAGREVEVRYSWTSVGIVDGELVTYDPDGDVQLVWDALDRVNRAWINYRQGDDDAHPELFYYVDGPPSWSDSGPASPPWERLPGAFGAGVDAAPPPPVEPPPT